MTRRATTRRQTLTKQKQDELEALRLPELQAKFAEVTGETSRSPNKKFLIRRISEALEDAGVATPEATTEKKAEPAEQAKTAETTDDPTDGEPKLSKLDVPELRTKYCEIVGRETRSNSKNYLIWKIKQAQQGKVPIGPRSRGEGIEHKVLPIRVPASAVADLDESWKRLGLKSRTEFFIRAVHAYLEGAGETDTAALFA